MRRWTPRTVCTARLGRPLSTQYMGAKRSSSIRGSASFRKTSAQLLSRRLAFFGVTRNWDCQRLSCGSRIRTSSPPSARRSAHDLLLHYPHLAPGWRGVFTNKSILDYEGQDRPAKMPGAGHQRRTRIQPSSSGAVVQGHMLCPLLICLQIRHLRISRLPVHHTSIDPSSLGFVLPTGLD